MCYNNYYIHYLWGADMTIELTKDELEQCKMFSRKCAENQQSIEFGQYDTDPRSPEEISRDNLIGKIAEVAFAKMVLRDYNLKIELDFNYYPRGQWDSQDTIINDWKIDVKGTRQGGKWMLIEWNKLNFRQKHKDLPHFFVMVSVFWDRKNDTPSGKVDLIGGISIQRLKEGCKKVKTLPKGTLLPEIKSKVKLQADNFGILFDNLERDWKLMINYILENDPPNLDNYPNPYTRETYRSLFPDDYR